MNKRPLGITILAALNIISGLGIIIIQVFLSDNFRQMMSHFNASSIPLFLSLTFIASTSLVAGIGMLKGRKWGWWLGAFCIAYSVIRNANAFREIMSMSEAFGISEDGVMRYAFKHGGRVVIHSIFFLYFFKENVMEYFSIRDYKKLESGLKIVGAGLVSLFMFIGVSMIVNQ